MKSNTTLEVMEAIVKNGGPIEAWVWDEGMQPIQEKVLGVDLDDTRMRFYTKKVGMNTAP